MKENIKYRFLGSVLFWVLKIISFTLKFKITNEYDVDIRKTYVYCFWHSKLVAPTIFFKNLEKKVALSSPTKDGELISVPLEKMGYIVIRGSSDKKSVSSTIKLLQFLRKGYSMGTPLDGPKGPREKAKKGLLYLAQKQQIELIPLGIAFEKKWVLKKTWDLFEIPKLFSRVFLIIGKPILIGKEENLDEFKEIIESKINENNDIAKKYLEDDSYE